MFASKFMYKSNNMFNNQTVYSCISKTQHIENITMSFTPKKMNYTESELYCDETSLISSTPTTYNNVKCIIQSLDHQSLFKQKLDDSLFKDTDILKNMLKKELLDKKNIIQYFENIQTEINIEMRRKVCDWLENIVQDCKCQIDVLFLSIMYIDQFLSKIVIKKSEFEILASVCLFIASKYIENIPLPSKFICEMIDCSYEKLIEWELFVLTKIDWKVNCLTVNNFIENFDDYLKADNIRKYAFSLGKISAMNWKFVNVNCSILAAACIYNSYSKFGTENYSDIAQLLASRIKCSSYNIKNISNKIETLL
jgi:hypothetical protein